MRGLASNRRRWLAGLLAFLGGCGLGSRANSAGTTPRAAEGPFYPTPQMRFADIDNDLVKIAGKVVQAGGEIVTLRGRVLDGAGQPLVGVRVEIWQCDANGRYLHSGDRQSVAYDQGFQGFGHDVTDAEGRYRFRTIKPVSYPGRTPHIHVKVLNGEREVLTTQFYLAGNPDNDGDFLYRRMSVSEAEAVSMAFDGAGEAVVDVVI